MALTKGIKDQIEGLMGDLISMLSEDFETSLEVKQEILNEVKKQVNELTVQQVHIDYLED